MLPVGRFIAKACSIRGRPIVDCKNIQLRFYAALVHDDRVIDLRSDTVTAPSRLMLEAALNATTGDDVMGEDPTVRELESYAATELFDKEAGLFVPTGTMANLVAIMAHCHTRGAEIIMGANSHICLYEGGNYASMGAVSSRQLQEDAITAQLDASEIISACRKDDDDHYAHTRLLCLENTHNMMGGVPLSHDYMAQMGELCKRMDINLHLDGARIFNAAEALKVPAKSLGHGANSVSICLSKGLGCPLGSVLVGNGEFIRLARRARKRCGGGMRQSGVIAAMGLFALKNNVSRLRDDHIRAKRLAKELQCHGFRLARHVETNMVFFALPEHSAVTKDSFAQLLAKESGIKLTGGYSRSGDMFRAVTHMDVSDEDVDRAAEAMVAICC